MDAVKKYGLVGIFGLMAIVAVNAATVSDFLTGLFTGFGITIMLYALFKIAASMKAGKTQSNA
jgi:hypothetical protein